jgi:hypothetical protein
MRIIRGTSQFFWVVMLLLACCAASAQNDEHRIRNIVLVHGAWADGSGWKGVYDILAFQVGIYCSWRDRRCSISPRISEE